MTVPTAQEVQSPVVRVVRPTAGPYLSHCPSMDSSFSWAPLSQPEWRCPGEGAQLDRALGKGRGLGHPQRKQGGQGKKVTWPGTLALTLPSVPLQCDRLAADCAQELRRHGVSYVSLWPGLVQTELLKDRSFHTGWEGRFGPGPPT